MNKKLSIFSNQVSSLCAGLISCLFAYAAISKLSSYALSRKQMLNQLFPYQVAILLTWLVPATEIILALALLFPQIRRASLFSSLLLLLIFSLYITISMSGIFGRIPCSCGGILGEMSYRIHLIFNVCFIIIAWMGLRFLPKKLNEEISSHLIKGKEGIDTACIK